MLKIGIDISNNNDFSCISVIRNENKKLIIDMAMLIDFKKLLN